MMMTKNNEAQAGHGTVEAGALSPWNVGELPEPPVFSWRQAKTLVGPGVLLAGASIGAGEWLFGPAVSAQYGATLLWLATLSIVFQAFYNIEVMRYALYCGEPIHVGFCRTKPGPKLWIFLFLVLEFASIWPFMASNAAVPLVAALLGHLPGGESVLDWRGLWLSEIGLVKFFGYVIFLAAFIPLIFGGKIYRMIERIMTLKLIVILIFFFFVTTFLISRQNVWEVTSSFLRLGAIPLRAETVIDGRHFTLTEQDASIQYTVKGSLENDRMLVTEFVVTRAGKVQVYGGNEVARAGLTEIQSRLATRAEAIVRQGGFFVEKRDEGVSLQLQGRINPDQSWNLEGISVVDAQGARRYESLEGVPDFELRAKILRLLDGRGVERSDLIHYWREHQQLPPLDWAMLAAFAAIAGAGGLTNSLFSNYARDKGWGMGVHVGAIPSAVGGRQIGLSHVGRVFHLSAESQKRWRGWLHHILRDQLIWTVCCFIGMGLPCMISLEFVRNAPISGNRVGAMVADGMAARLPEFGPVLWPLVLLVSFLILAPNQIHSVDQIARRWTDIIWVTSARTRRLEDHKVKYLYYGIMFLYGIWGLFALWFFNPLQMAKLGSVLMNVALGATALHTLYVNRTLLPRELQGNWFIRAGVLGCGIFFLGITVVVLFTL